MTVAALDLMGRDLRGARDSRAIRPGRHGHRALTGASPNEKRKEGKKRRYPFHPNWLGVKRS
ncbi:hypothetical protein ACFB49_37830 [Sphingomonas sp. DBB INV C78]